ncbi:integrin alpha [Planctomycetota bacterium]
MTIRNPDTWGRAYLYYGGEPMDAVCDKTFTGEASSDQFSSAVFLSDIDADGLSDVLICARFAADYRGRVYIYWGANDFRGSSPDLTLEGEQRSHMGGDEIVCGYFNNDEYGDILVGGFGYPDPHYPENRMGRAYIFNGNARASMDQLTDHVFEGESGHSGRFGIAVSSGDLNNDNYDDVVVGAWGYNNRQGRAYLYYGPFESSTDITFTWNTSNASPGKHILKASIAPVAGEEDEADNVSTATVYVKTP